MASDLISREGSIIALRRLAYQEIRGRAFVPRDAVERMLERQREAVDAVEVVRCKDCFKRNDPSRCPMCYDEWYYDDDDGSDFIRQDNTIDDGFCHVGAKMDGGEQDAQV